jgi:hypothetical protein
MLHQADFSKIFGSKNRHLNMTGDRRGFKLLSAFRMLLVLLIVCKKNLAKNAISLEPPGAFFDSLQLQEHY